jgi:hypothetical protein
MLSLNVKPETTRELAELCYELRKQGHPPRSIAKAITRAGIRDKTGNKYDSHRVAGLIHVAKTPSKSGRTYRLHYVGEVARPAEQAQLQFVVTETKPAPKLDLAIEVLKSKHLTDTQARCIALEMLTGNGK